MFLNSLTIAAALPSLVIVALGALLTYLICRLATPIGKTLGLLDWPGAKDHANHEHATPLVGGIAVVLPMLIFSLIDSQFPIVRTWIGVSQASLWFVGAVAAMLLMGALDDRLDISPRLRLVVMLLTSTVFVWKNPIALLYHLDAPHLGIYLLLGRWAMPFTVLCITALVNAVNMADGRNGLVIGMCIIWCMALLTVAVNPRPIGLLMVTTSLCVAFVYNLRGRLFLGDGGTYSLAAFIGISAIVSHNFIHSLTSTQIACLFSIPVLDMVRVIFERLWRGVSPAAAGHDHLHHYLARFCGWKLGLPIYLTMVAAPIAVGFGVTKRGSTGLALALLLYLVVWGVTRKRGVSVA
jgi:UDP-GlcNAc:undecaprenyl-phosphate GlcNAc-1-phosphate transferase